jgi:hypothetical protein
MYPQQAQLPQIKRKNHILGFILEFFIGGLGFLYAGAGWGKAIIMFVITWALYAAQVTLRSDSGFLPGIIGLVTLVFLIYRLVTLMRFISRRNRGGL